MKTLRLILLAGILALSSCLYPGEDWGFELAVKSSLSEKTCERLVLTGSYEILRGSAEIEEGGFYYSSTDSNPLPGKAKKLQATMEGSVFTAKIEQLSPSTTYYVKPYVRSGKSYVYAEVKTLKTDATTAYTPLLSGPGSSDIGVQKATLTAVVQLSNTSYPLMEAGFCYSDSVALPSLHDSYVQVEPVNGSITYTFSSLKPLQRYYVRAYAMNALGTFYGSTIEFSTAGPVTWGAVQISKLSSTGFTAAVGLQTPYAEEGITLVESGFCYATASALPSFSDQTISAAVANGQISADLAFGEHISLFVRAYAKCSNQEYYYSSALKVGDKSFTVKGVSFDMVAVDGGSFEMGATGEQYRSAGPALAAPGYAGSQASKLVKLLNPNTQDDESALRSVRDNEKPVHTVTLSPYYIGKYEVSQELWQAVMGYNNSGYDNSELNPAENISWYECLVFVDKLKALTGAAFVMPTEAQWEYAARGGLLREGYQYAGSDLCDSVAWTKANSSDRPQVVGSKQPNGLGIHDMSGNVEEKCYDWYAADYYSNSPAQDPSGPTTGKYRVQRGGDYYNDADWARVSSRSWRHPDSCYVNHGFRLALREGMTLPVVEKVSMSEMTASGNAKFPVRASFTVSLSSAGSGSVSEKGFCISELASPDLTDIHFHIDTIADTYDLGVVMKENIKFYVRSYAISQAGVAYGEEMSFTTPSKPVVSTLAVSDITASTADCGGIVSNDGGLDIIARGVCWSTSSNPTIKLSTKTVDGVGLGTFASHLENLTIGTKYYVRAYATNAIGTTYGEELSFTTLHIRFNDNIHYGSISDIDGNNYKTVSIGTQTWMAENLKTTKYNDGTNIPNITSDNSWDVSTTGAWCYYNNYSTNNEIYGKLYNWFAVGTGKLCPQGWRVPTISEWENIGNNNLYLKEIGSEHWHYYSGITDMVTNGFGFTALPGGYRNDIGGDFLGMGTSAIWWSSSSYLSYWAYYCSMYNSSTSVYTASNDDKQYGYSVRCLKDDSSAPTSLPSLTTNDVISITQTSAQCGGNISSDGGSAVMERGVCWSTYSNPTMADNKTSNGSGTGAFTANLTGLTSNTTYYVRAYATNSIGTQYGNQLSFTTHQSQGFIEYVNIPSGTFTMGSPTSEKDRGSDETQHSVTLSAFKMSKYAVTNAQYAIFLNEKGIGSDGIYAGGKYPSEVLISASSGSYNWGLQYTAGAWSPVAGYANHPVIYVSWYGADEFARYVGGRLPTEAEWEYACRAGTTTPFNTGNCLTNTQANYYWAYPYGSCTNTGTTYPGKTQAVGSYPANAWGLYDMHGNVWEWCSDWYGSYSTYAQTNPTGPSTGSYRVLRGGSWYNDAQDCRSAFRGSLNPGYGSGNIGFRVVLVP